MDSISHFRYCYRRSSNRQRQYYKRCYYRYQILIHPATVTYIITPKNSTCTGNTFTLTVTVNPLPKITAIPASSPICSKEPANITLTSNIANTSYTWTSTASNGITGNTNQANGVVTTGIQDVLINNGATPGTVTYTITPYNGTCSGTPIIASVVVQPLPVESKPGPDGEICSTTTYTLQGNDPSPGTGKWTQIAGPPQALLFLIDTKPNAVVSGLIPGNLYQFRWTITATPTCPTNSNAVNITIDKATIGGTTTEFRNRQFALAAMAGRSHLLASRAISSAGNHRLIMGLPGSRS